MKKRVLIFSLMMGLFAVTGLAKSKEKAMSEHFTGFAFNLIYADDQAKTVAFYEKHFGFRAEEKLPDGSVWGHAGPVALWIGGGYKRVEQDPNSTHTSIMYRVQSTGKLFRQLRDSEVRTVQEQPQKMSDNQYWFQFFDSAGNIIEVLGAE